MKVLVVDDEPSLLDTVANRLKKDGYTVLTSQTAEEAIKQYRFQKPDLIILDVMLPGRSGFDLSKIIREESQVPILFLSARASEMDRVKGFEVGGDDYLTKPFNLSELSARVNAILRRSRAISGPEPIITGDLEIFPDLHEAYCKKKKMELKPKEFALLCFFASHPGKVFSRDVLLDRVWGPEAFVTPRTVDVHVSWLRKQIEKIAGSNQRIFTVRGVGYKFV